MAPFSGLAIAIIAVALVASSSPVRATHFTVTSQIYLDFEHDGQPIGRTTIGLFGELAPRTVANFRQLCVHGIDGYGSYAGTRMHRIIDKFMVQGGDVVAGNGSGSISIYGRYFDDELLTINHTGPGFLAMANKGPNTNGCQFYITTMAAPWLDGKHTIFGKVVNGQGYVHMVERVRTQTDDTPERPVIVSACGEMPMGDPYTVSDNLYE